MYCNHGFKKKQQLWHNFFRIVPCFGKPFEWRQFWIIYLGYLTNDRFHWINIENYANSLIIRFTFQNIQTHATHTYTRARLTNAYANIFDPILKIEHKFRAISYICVEWNQSKSEKKNKIKNWKLHRLQFQFVFP